MAAERVQDSEGLAALEAALGALDPEQRTIVLLRDQRGLDYDEIGYVLGIAVGTVKSRLFRARAALRDEIERRLGRD
jgi:RNA polymerase sigma-70 factor (ECF subfamily)